MPAVHLSELLGMVPDQSGLVTPRSQKVKLNRSTTFSPSNSVESFETSDSEAQDFVRAAPGRSKSASAKMQTIRERRFRLTSPMISPNPFPMDVFGESPLSLDVWDEDDKFTSFVPRRRKEKRGLTNSASFDKSPTNTRMKGLRQHVADIDLSAFT